jgi:hypothetical protein
MTVWRHKNEFFAFHQSRVLCFKASESVITESDLLPCERKKCIVRLVVLATKDNWSNLLFHESGKLPVLAVRPLCL